MVETNGRPIRLQPSPGRPLRLCPRRSQAVPAPLTESRRRGRHGGRCHNRGGRDASPAGRSHRCSPSNVARRRAWSSSGIHAASRKLLRTLHRRRPRRLGTWRTPWQCGRALRRCRCSGCCDPFSSSTSATFSSSSPGGDRTWPTTSVDFLAPVHWSFAPVQESAGLEVVSAPAQGSRRHDVSGTEDTAPLRVRATSVRVSRQAVHVPPAVGDTRAP